jgi:hypothetical protein
VFMGGMPPGSGLASDNVRFEGEAFAAEQLNRRAVDRIGDVRLRAVLRSPVYFSPAPLLYFASQNGATGNRTPIC